MLPESSSVPETPDPKHGRFDTTHWTLIEVFQNGEAPDALAELIQTYEPAIRSRIARQVSSQEVDDLTVPIRIRPGDHERPSAQRKGEVAEAGPGPTPDDDAAGGDELEHGWG